MKKFSLALTLLCAGLTIAAADDVLPQPESFSRYAPMLKHSPFAVASAGAVGAAPDFAKDLYVANAAHTDNGDFVTIASTTDRNFKEYLHTGETTDGFNIPSIDWSDRVGETKVTITKDGQVATLGFNEAVLNETLQGQTPEIQRPVPGIAGRSPMNLPMPHPMNIPTIPTPPPHTRPIIRRTFPQQQQQQQIPQRQSRQFPVPRANNPELNLNPGDDDD